MHDQYALSNNDLKKNGSLRRDFPIAIKIGECEEKHRKANDKNLRTTE